MSARIWKRRRVLKVDLKWRRRESKKVQKLLNDAARILGIIRRGRNWR